MTKELTVRNLYGIRGEITHRTDSNTLVITGENGAGKSSFVNAFVHIFAHKATKGAPNPVHEGMTDGEATYTDEDLGLAFSRRWRGGKMTSVEVRALDGARYQDGTAMLKDRIGTVTVDVAEFLAVDESKRRDLIMSKATFPEGFDLDELNREHLSAETRRTDAAREAKRLQGALSELTPPAKDTPDGEVSVAGLLAEVQEARQSASDYASILNTIANAAADVQDLRVKLEEAEARLAGHEARLDVTENVSPAIIAELEAKLGSVEEVNRAVRDKAQFLKVKAEADAAAAVQAEAVAQVASVKKRKFDGLAEAIFPDPSMSVDDENVLLDGVPFVYANGKRRALAAVQVAIAGEHADTDLRLVVIRDGDWLDAAALAELDELLTARGFFGLIDRGRPDMPSVAGIDVVELSGGVRA